jgi:hypothetical protein
MLQNSTCLTFDTYSACLLHREARVHHLAHRCTMSDRDKDVVPCCAGAVQAMHLANPRLVKSTRTIMQVIRCRGRSWSFEFRVRGSFHSLSHRVKSQHQAHERRLQTFLVLMSEFQDVDAWLCEALSPSVVLDRIFAAVPI